MNLPRPLTLLAVAGATLLAAVTLAWSPQARSQINAAPSWVPMGVSPSGNGSMAWFHEPGSRQAVACQATAGPTVTVQCVTARLP